MAWHNWRPCVFRNRCQKNRNEIIYENENFHHEMRKWKFSFFIFSNEFPTISCIIRYQILRHFYSILFSSEQILFHFLSALSKKIALKSNIFVNFKFWSILSDPIRIQIFMILVRMRICLICIKTGYTSILQKTNFITINFGYFPKLMGIWILYLRRRRRK